MKPENVYIWFLAVMSVFAWCIVNIGAELFQLGNPALRITSGVVIVLIALFDYIDKIRRT